MTTEEIIDSVVDKHTEFSDEQKKSYRDMLRKVLIEEQTVLEASGIDKTIFEVAYTVAYNKYQTGLFEEALNMFSVLYNYDNTDPRYPLGAAACHHKLGNYKEAVTYYLGGVSSVANESPLPYYYASDCFTKMGQPMAALIMLDLVLTKAESNPNFYAQIIERAQLTYNKLLEEQGIDPAQLDEETSIEVLERFAPTINKRIERIKAGQPAIKKKKIQKPSGK